MPERTLVITCALLPYSEHCKGQQIFAAHLE
jgi:hypothetical protein